MLPITAAHAKSQCCHGLTGLWLQLRAHLARCQGLAPCTTLSDPAEHCKGASDFSPAMVTFKVLGKPFELTQAELARCPGSVLTEAAACERKASDPIHIKGWKAQDCSVFQVSPPRERASTSSDCLTNEWPLPATLLAVVSWDLRALMSLPAAMQEVVGCYKSPRPEALADVDATALLDALDFFGIQPARYKLACLVMLARLQAQPCTW